MQTWLLLLALAGATSYRVTITPAKGTPVVAHVVAAGGSKRVTVERPKDEPFDFDVLLIDGSAVTALNTQLKTWYEGEPRILPPPRIYKPMYPFSKTERRDITTSVEEEQTEETIAGHALRKFVVRIHFVTRETVNGDRIESTNGTTILVWTTVDYDEPLAAPSIPFTTGVSDVDAQLAPKLAAIHGFPLKTALSATRIFAGGTPQTAVLTAIVDEVQPATADAALFHRPADYVNQKPIVSGPGRN